MGCDGKKANGGAAGAPKTIRIGYIVKDGTAEWFRNEVKFATEAGRKDGFEVVEVSPPTAAR